MVGALIAALVVFAFCAIASPLIGLIGLLAVIFIRPGEIYPDLAPLHIERIVSIVVMLAFVARGNKIRFPRVTGTFLFFWATMFCSVPLSFWPGGAFQASLDFGKAVIYYLLIANLAITSSRLRTILIAFCAMTSWLAGQAFLEYQQGATRFTMGIDRAIGLNNMSNDPNALGITLVTTLPFLAIFCYRNAGRIRWLAIPLLGLCVWTIVLTGSRASYITLGLLAILYALSSKQRVAAVLAVVVLAGALWAVMPAQYQDRLKTVNDLAEDESYQGRVAAWHAAWDLFKSNPLTGVGATMFIDSRGAASGHWLNVHSLYFQVLAELGLLGTFAFGLFIFSIFQQNQRMRRELEKSRDHPQWLDSFPRACNLALMGLLVAGYSSHSLYRDTWYLLAGFSTAAMFVLRTEFGQIESQSVDQNAASLAAYGTVDYANARSTA